MGTTIKRRTLKDGTIKEYVYETNKTYNDKYYITNKELLLEKIKCPCGGSYHRLNRHTHNKTKRHGKYVIESNYIQDILDE
jgi:hypothetical protein